MTTSVRVQACCSANLQVRVSVTGEPDTILQNGEQKNVSVYDDRVISVKEEPKPDPA